MVVLLDGTVVDAGTPVLRADDLGILRGDGVFETLLVVDGRPRKLDAHLDRLARSAASLDLPEPDRAAWTRCVETVCGLSPGPGELVLKLVLTRGVDGSGEVTGYALTAPVPAETLAQRRDGVHVLSLDRGYPAGFGERAPWLLLGAKSLSYATNMAAIRYARAHGADDAIYLTGDGWVLEGATATVVLASGRELRTPPVSAGLLPGTTQEQLFRAAEGAGWSTKTEPVRLDDLFAADGVWLVSSVRRLVQVRSLDGRPLPLDTPLHSELLALLG